jgi:murein DD-endopeptidase MepM/ murein hydrolase activator NlpD
MNTVRASVALILAAAGSAAAGSTERLPVTIEVRARELVPGEPVRLEVTAAEPLASLEGEFLGRGVFFVRQEGSPPAERWSGWSMIDLDQAPGVAAVELRGESVSGKAVTGTRAVTIEPKEFPREELSVAPKYVEPPPEVRERLARERAKLGALYESRRAAAPSNRVFVRPVPGEATSVFGTRRVYNGKPRSPHPGLDLRAATGTTVGCSGDGRVGLAQDLYYSGNTVIVDHGGGLFTLYAHLSELRVREGDEVTAGQPVGLSGATGRVTGPHLHWGAKIGDLPFDPRALLDERLFADGAQ